MLVTLGLGLTLCTMEGRRDGRIGVKKMRGQGQRGALTVLDEHTPTPPRPYNVTAGYSHFR